MSTRNRRIAIVAIWVAAFIGWVLYQRSTGLSTLEALQEFVDTARGAWWAFAAFVIIYMIRPLLLFSAALLTVAAGILFGPVLGIVATVIGANLSAMIAYWIGRSLAGDTLDPSGDPTEGDEADGDTASDDDAAAEQRSQVRRVIDRWSERMRANSFSTVMVMRLAFLPFDLVNYAAGALRIRPLPFLAATAIGSFPGTVSFVLAGASIERIDEGLSGFDPKVFVASAVLFVVSVGIAQVLKRREGNDDENPTEPDGLPAEVAK